jgi:multidrug resistance efflux pump
MTLRLLALLVFAGTVAAQEPLRLEGEIVAREKAALMPPAVEGLWQLSITQLSPDGATVKQGEPVLAFDGGQLQQMLLSKESALKEKQSQRDKLTLELAERERTERLATEDRRAQRDKAQRKATQPEDLLRRVDYQKLVIERRQAESQLQLAQRREVLAAEQRRQEQRLVAAELALLEDEVAELKRGLQALTVLAPRDGVMLHKSSWQGEKFDVGSQVWRGQAVAEIPDLASLEVLAQLPERELLQVRSGAAARISIEGGGQQVDGRVLEIGRIVRSKSRNQPLPVVDLRIQLLTVPDGLKPGQSVRVDLPVTATGAGA